MIHFNVILEGRKRMFQFLFIFGPAAVTYLLVQKCSKISPLNWYTAVIELICYGAIDAVITIIVLYPLNKVTIIALPDGMNTVQYGSTAFVFSMGVSVICGIVFAMLKKRAEIYIELEENGKDTKDDFKKD